MRCSKQLGSNAFKRMLLPNVAATRQNVRSCFKSRTLIMATRTGDQAQDIQLYRDAKVVVASTPLCKYCRQAKSNLEQNKVSYLELDVSSSPALRSRIKEMTGQSTVPQIFVNGASIGGASDLTTGLENGSFLQLLDSCQAPALPADLLEEVERTIKQQAAVMRQQQASTQPDQDTPSLLLTKITQKLHRTGCDSFSPVQLVGFIRKALSELKDSSDAVEIANALIASKLVVLSLAGMVPGVKMNDIDALIRQEDLTAAVTVKTYRSKEAALASTGVPAPGAPLNAQFYWYGSARPVIQVSEDLRAAIVDLYGRHLSADGKAVRYSEIATDPQFSRYVELTAELQKVDLRGLTRNELMALFINLYNSLIIHTLVVHGPPTSTLDRMSFFTQKACYNIGGQLYSADDMENGVLRGNRAAASNLWNLLGIYKLAGSHFSPNDPRASLVVTDPDCRIHFALVCGAKSCPPISVYTADTLEEGLEAATQAFCSSEVSVDKTKNTVKMSQIFKWYAIDFGAKPRDQLITISKLLSGQAKRDLEELLSTGNAIKVSYSKYDWGLNSSDTQLQTNRK